MQIAGNHIIHGFGQEIYQGGVLKISWGRIRTIVKNFYKLMYYYLSFEPNSIKHHATEERVR